MDYSDKLPSTILLEAASNLQNGNWTQGNFFTLKDDQPCFCVHGSIQYCGSKEVKKWVDQKDLAAAEAAFPALAAATTSAAAEAAAPALEYWNECYQSKYPQYRNLFLAHHYAQRVGLSYDFNDAKNRTKEEVIAKLKEAAQLAQSESN